jgi:hypothetical protein
MGQYRKKPVVIDAFRWTEGPEQIEDPEWIIEAIKAGTMWTEAPYRYIRTMEGTIRVSPGDWILKGIAGEIYPCKDAIFRQTYELVE